MPKGRHGRYLKGLSIKALDYCDLVDERMLVNIYLHSMIEEYLIFLENFSFSSFSKLMKAACCTNESVQLSSTSRSSSNSSSWKRQPSRNEKGHVVQSKEANSCRRGPKQFPTLPLFPCDEWIELSPCVKSIIFPPFEEQEDPMYCRYHQKKGHTLKQ